MLYGLYTWGMYPSGISTSKSSYIFVNWGKSGRCQQARKSGHANSHNG